MAGRIYAEIGGTINTGVAIVNPSNAQASITVTFTDTNGTNVGPVIPPILLPANRQLTAFLNQEPLQGPSPFEGTFTFVSTVKIAVTALRINQNSQGEIILSTLPVVNLNAPQTGALYFPHFAAGGGWTSHVLLINPSDAMITGNIQFWTSEGQPGSVTIGGQTGSSFGYRIPAKSSQRF